MNKKETNERIIKMRMRLFEQYLRGLISLEELSRRVAEYEIEEE